MQVILLQDVRNVGKKYDVVDVAEGYVRNYLMPNNLCQPATDDRLARLQEWRMREEEQAQRELAEVQELASAVEGKNIEMSVRAGEKGQLFEQITAVKIAEQLQKEGYAVRAENINLEDPIQEVGEYGIPLELDHGLEASFTLNITAHTE